LEALVFHSLTSSASRRILVGTVLGLATLTSLAVAPASARSIDPEQHSQRLEEAAPTKRTVTSLDSFMIMHTPHGIGSPTDFEYEWEDVVFHSRVWETGPDAEGATKVDLTVKTMRGEALSDLEALRTWLTEYHEKDPAEWDVTSVRVGAYGGYMADDRLFYFVSPGVAAEVTIDLSRFSQQDLIKTARGFRPQRAGQARTV
jgi:hypothetical protein